MPAIPQKAQDYTEPELMPPDWYSVMITKSEEKNTSSGGKMLVITQRVIDGEYTDRVIWNNFNWVNANPKAEEIAFRQLTELMTACDVSTPESTEELHGIPILAFVGIEKGTAGYPDKNIVKKWRAMDEDSTDSNKDSASW